MIRGISLAAADEKFITAVTDQRIEGCLTIRWVDMFMNPRPVRDWSRYTLDSVVSVLFNKRCNPIRFISIKNGILCVSNQTIIDFNDLLPS